MTYPAELYQKTVLANGVTIVTEQVPSVHSVSLGVWIITGSRDEDTAQNGIAHFIEHMFFKGTARRSAQDISKEIDSVGGILNALTSKEYTGIYAKVLDKHVGVASDIISDAFLHSTFDPGEIEREREVIVQEILMSEDTPDEHIQELFSKSFFRDHPLAMPILGSRETVGGINRDTLLAFLTRQHYHPSKIIISATGKVNHDRIVGIFQEQFGGIPRRNSSPSRLPLKAESDLAIYTKPLEQIHICIGTQGVTQDDTSRYAGYVLNAIMGGSMSSRLFQEIREKKGLAYSIYSYFSSYFDAGMFVVYLGVSKKVAREAIRLVVAELNKVRECGITEGELRTAQEHLKGHTLLAAESPDSRMTRLAKCEMYFNRFIPLEEILSSIDRVSADDVQRLAQEIFNRRYLSLAALGPVTDRDISADLLDA